jgi:hypothetical protein
MDHAQRNDEQKLGDWVRQLKENPSWQAILSRNGWKCAIPPDDSGARAANRGKLVLEPIFQGIWPISDEPQPMGLTDWCTLGRRYCSFQICHRRFQRWVCSGVMTRIITALAHELCARGLSMFASNKTWQGTKIMMVADRLRMQLWEIESSLRGYRTFAARSFDMSGTPRPFSRCFNSPQL